MITVLEYHRSNEVLEWSTQRTSIEYKNRLKVSLTKIAAQFHEVENGNTQQTEWKENYCPLAARAHARNSIWSNRERWMVNVVCAHVGKRNKEEDNEKNQSKRLLSIFPITMVLELQQKPTNLNTLEPVNQNWWEWVRNYVCVSVCICDWWCIQIDQIRNRTKTLNIFISSLSRKYYISYTKRMKLLEWVRNGQYTF